MYIGLQFLLFTKLNSHFFTDLFSNRHKTLFKQYSFTTLCTSSIFIFALDHLISIQMCYFSYLRKQTSIPNNNNNNIQINQTRSNFSPTFPSRYYTWYSRQWQDGNWTGHVDKGDIPKNGGMRASVLAAHLPLTGYVTLRKAFAFADLVLGHNH